jgi:hypothetical protein
MMSAGRSRVFKGSPRDLEKQPELRIHHLRLARRDAEQLRVESSDLVQETGPVRPRVGQTLEEVLPVRIHWTHCRLAAAQEVPELAR